MRARLTCTVVQLSEFNLSGQHSSFACTTTATTACRGLPCKGCGRRCVVHAEHDATLLDAGQLSGVLAPAAHSVSGILDLQRPDITNIVEYTTIYKEYKASGYTIPLPDSPSALPSAAPPASRRARRWPLWRCPCSPPAPAGTRPRTGPCAAGSSAERGPSSV